MRPCSGRRSERDDRRDRCRRNTAEYDDGPPSRDGGGQLLIFKVFNVGSYEGSVQVPKPSAILFRGLPQLPSLSVPSTLHYDEEG